MLHASMVSFKNTLQGIDTILVARATVVDEEKCSQQPQLVAMLVPSAGRSFFPRKLFPRKRQGFSWEKIQPVLDANIAIGPIAVLDQNFLHCRFNLSSWARDAPQK